MLAFMVLIVRGDIMEPKVWLTLLDLPFKEKDPVLAKEFFNWHFSSAVTVELLFSLNCFPEDIKLADVKLCDLPSWFSRRDKSVGGVANALVKSFYRFEHYYFGHYLLNLVCFYPLPVLLVMIYSTIPSTSSLVFKFCSFYRNV